jgi:hypothetical protein
MPLTDLPSQDLLAHELSDEALHYSPAGCRLEGIRTQREEVLAGVLDRPQGGAA